MLRIPKRWIKFIGYMLGSILVLLFAVWGILYWYVSNHKQEIISKIEQTTGDKIQGKVKIKNIQPDFFKSFPMISFRLDSVQLKDSLYHIYEKNLLEIEHVYARLNIISIFKGKPSFSKLSVENGSFNIFIDTNGYSNNYLLQAKDTTQPKASNDQGINISKFEIREFNVVIDNKLMDKRFAFLVEKLKGNVAENETNLKLSFDLATKFEQLGFNLDLGSFLKNAQLKTHFDINFDKASHAFHVEKTTLDIDGQKVNFEANILFDKNQNLPFEMKFEAQSVDFNKGIHWMSENIYKKLSKLHFTKKLNIAANIKGALVANNQNPHIQLVYNTNNNTLKLFDYTLTDVSFKGRYDNELVKNLPRHDSNAIVTLDTVSANFSGLPIRGKNVSLTNLKHPFAKAELAASFDAKIFNNFFGNQFTFTKGTASYDINYDGELFLNTLIAEQMFGKINLDNVDFMYNERKLKFQKGTLRLRFNGDDLIFDKFQVFSNNSDINITGTSKNFLTAFMELPGKAQMNLHLNSKHIDFGAFQTYFVQKRNTNTPNNTGNAIKNASNKLDDFLSNSSIVITMNIQNAIYKKIGISNLGASMQFTEAGIGIDRLNFQHADGIIYLKAGINQQSINNPFFANFDVEKVKVDKFMYAMNNFGFKGLSDKNVNGLISIQGQLKGNFTDRGELLENTLDGKLEYELQNAALKNLSFFDKIKRFLRNRGLENVQVDHFKGSLTINNGIITIPHTKLETSALHLSFAGKYGISKGKPTAMDVRVPLRNPQVDLKRQAEGKKKRKGEGIVLNFKATSDATGKINIGVGKTEGAKGEGMNWTEDDD